MIDLPVLLTEVDSDYLVQVRSLEVGETPQPPPRVSYNDLATIGAALLKARADDADKGVVARLGEELFAKLFQGPNHALYLRARAISVARACSIRLLLAMAPRSPLQRIPWELLHDGKGFLARDLHCSIVRYIEGPQPVRTIALKPPIRILVTSASPRGLEELDLESEMNGIGEIYQKFGRAAVVKYCHSTSLKSLREILHGAVLANEPFHVWHHCGHGGITTASGKEEFRLCLERKGRLELAGTSDILRILKKCSGLRVAVLNVCSAGSAVGLAPELARLNVPSVLSFASKIGDARARRFSLALHRGLLKQPIEVAVDTARASICDPDLETWHWSDLLLFSRRSDRGPLRKSGWPNDTQRGIKGKLLQDLNKAFS